MLAVALALNDQVPQVRQRHVGAMQGEQRFFSVVAFAVATRADHPDHCFRIGHWSGDLVRRSKAVTPILGANLGTFPESSYNNQYISIA
jgi:hypothetical protein